MLRAIKGGKAAPPKPGPAKPAVKPVPERAVGPDDVPVIALNLAPAKLSPAMAAYFKKCQDKLGFVPNVLARLRLRHDEARNFRCHVQRPDARATPGFQSSSAR